MLARPAGLSENPRMYLVLLLIACYTMRWSANVLIGDVFVGNFESLWVFSAGLFSLFLAAWSLVHLAFLP